MRKTTLALFCCLCVLAALTSPAAGDSSRRRSTGGSNGEVDSAEETSTATTSSTTTSPDQHGPLDGHMPGVQKNMKLVSKLRLTEVPGAVSDVSYHRGYAYVGAYNSACDAQTGEGGGVWVVDVRDIQNPKMVGFLPSHPGNYVSEGVDIIRVNTRFFQGDLLLHSNEQCVAGVGAVGGIDIWDVTDPEFPILLAQGAGDTTDDDVDPPEVFERASYTHSVMGWAAGNKAYAVLVDNEELDDVDIMNITNPVAPRHISEVGLPHWPQAQDNLAYGGEVFHHDMWVKKISGNWRLAVSYWDAGWVFLNVNDPKNPIYIGDTDYPATDPLTGKSPPEGNAHQGAWNWNNKLFLGTDEDFSPYRLPAVEITTGANAGEYQGGEFGWALPIAQLPDKELNGPTVFGGYGCDADNDIPLRSTVFPEGSLAENEEAILVLSRGPVSDPNANYAACTFQEKAENAAAAGYDAVAIANHHVGSDAGASPDSAFCGSGTGVDINAICISHRMMHLLFNTTPSYEVPYESPDADDNEPDPGELGEDLKATSIFDAWGYLNLINAQTLEHLDAYAPKPALQEEWAFGHGALSIHEIKNDRRKGVNLGYISWYSLGMRVVGFNKERGIRPLGKYIHPKGNDFWGVFPIYRGEHRRPYILGSDRDSGLWIFKYTGPEPGGTFPVRPVQ